MMKLTLLEKSLNKALSYNLKAEGLLQQLEGKLLVWEVESYGLMLSFMIHEGHVSVHAKEHRNPTCWIKAHPRVFTQLFRQDPKGLSLDVKGDVQVLFQFAQLFHYKELDWTVMLADYCPAFFVNEITRFYKKNTVI